jgi:hypothetical protein
MKVLSQILVSQALSLNLTNFEVNCTNSTLDLICKSNACSSSVICHIKFINPENKEPENKEPENKEPENKEPENTGTSKQIRVNAAAPSSLGSLDCLDKKGQEFVDKQKGIDFKTTHFCGAPRGPNGVACGEILTLNMGGRSTFCEVVWNAQDPSPGNWAYVEIYKKPYEELTGKSIVNDMLFDTGYFMAECKGSCF